MPNVSESVNRSPPGNTVVSQIHNAPGWQHSRTYTYAAGPFTRVVNGPGWNEPTGDFKPGQTLNAYQLTSTGSCTSAASGGPNGTGTEIADGTCTWKYLSNVDYVSVTGWAFDNTPWQAQAYFFGDNIVSDTPLRSYRLLNAAGCTSTVAPAGTGVGIGAPITMSDGCQWTYWADITYTSGISHIPTQTYANNARGQATRHLVANYQADLWNDREYLAGQNGENAPILLQAHFDYTPDGFPYSPEGIYFIPTTAFYHLIVTTAPGESFRDTRTPAMPLTGYDPTKGVALHNTVNRDYAAGIELRDNFVDLIGLQIKSDYRQGVGGGETHGGNYVSIQYSIIDGGAANTAAVHLDGLAVIANSLILTRGAFGVVEDYPGIMLHSTLVNLSRVPNSVAVASLGPWVFNGAVISNSAMFGFSHAAMGTMTWGGGNNFTDAPVGDAGSGLWPDGRTVTTVAILPGTAYGTPAQGVFANFPGDYRLGASSPLMGSGTAYGLFTSNCDAKHPGCAESVSYNFDNRDIIGTPRPQAGHYDIGAWQSTHGLTSN